MACRPVLIKVTVGGVNTKREKREEMQRKDEREKTVQMVCQPPNQTGPDVGPFGQFKRKAIAEQWQWQPLEHQKSTQSTETSRPVQTAFFTKLD